MEWVLIHPPVLCRYILYETQAGQCYLRTVTLSTTDRQSWEQELLWTCQACGDPRCPSKHAGPMTAHLLAHTREALRTGHTALRSWRAEASLEVPESQGREFHKASPKWTQRPGLTHTQSSPAQEPCEQLWHVLSCNTGLAAHQTHRPHPPNPGRSAGSTRTRAAGCVSTVDPSFHP